MKRNKMMSVQNIHRSNWMGRMIKLLKTGRPPAEYEVLTKHMVANLRHMKRKIRLGTNYPYFNMILTEDKPKLAAKIRKTAPSIWIEEFLKLPQDLRYKIMTERTGSKIIKDYYKNRCQHNEGDNMICENCNRAHSCYKSNIVKQKIIEIDELVKESHEWYGKKIRIMRDGQWMNSDEREFEDLTEDDLIVIDWDLPSERYLLVEKLGLEINTALKETLEVLHTINKRL